MFEKDSESSGSEFEENLQTRNRIYLKKKSVLSSKKHREKIKYLKNSLFKEKETFNSFCDTLINPSIEDYKQSKKRLSFSSSESFYSSGSGLFKFKMASYFLFRTEIRNQFCKFPKFFFNFQIPVYKI